MMERILLFIFIAIILPINKAEAKNSTFYTGQHIEQQNKRKRIESVESMVKIFYGKVLHVYVPRIENGTNSLQLPSDISIMVRSIFNSIGQHVNLLSYINSNNLPKDDAFIINGAITGFDAMGESSEDGLQISGEGKKAKELASISIKDNISTKITQLGMVFNPSSAKSGFYIPRTSTSNMIDIREMSDSDKSTYSIFGVSLNLEDRKVASDGVHHSLRLLIEISTIEVLGRLVKYPYWILTKTEVNQDILDYLVKSFIRDSLNSKLEKISYLLSLKDSNLKVTSTINNRLRDAIINYKRANRLTPNDIISRKLYRSLLEDT